MLPAFLGAFRPQRENYQLDYLKLAAQPLGAGVPTALTQSKLLGQPYLPAGTPYPHDERGQPMILLAQINFAEAPALPPYPTAGILQLFVSPTEWYDMDDYCVLEKIRFGDSGLAHLFINPTALQERRFDQAYFY